MMKDVWRHGRPSRWLLPLGALLVPLALAAGCGAGQPEDTVLDETEQELRRFGGTVLPPDTLAYGGYVWQTIRWTSWLYSVPEDRNPSLDTMGEHCAEGQSGNVWFLARSRGSAGHTRSCTIPAGKAIFTPVVFVLDSCPLDNGGIPPGIIPGVSYTEVDCSKRHFGASSDLRGFANYILDFYADTQATIDGVAVEHLTVPTPRSPYRLATPGFPLHFPADSIYHSARNTTQEPTVTAGLFLLIRPLPPGKHTIKLHNKSTSPVLGPIPQVDDTYELTVTR